MPTTTNHDEHDLTVSTPFGPADSLDQELTLYWDKLEVRNLTELRSALSESPPESPDVPELPERQQDFVDRYVAEATEFDRDTIAATLEDNMQRFDEHLRPAAIIDAIHIRHSRIWHSEEAIALGQALADAGLADYIREAMEKHRQSLVEPPEPHELPQVEQQGSHGQGSDASPRQVRRTLEEYAANGSEEAQDALELWRRSGAAGYDSPSEADQAFCNYLAFWCRCDESLIDACVRQSARHRSKWDSRRGESTYGEQTIEEAVSTQRDTFSGRYVQ